MVSGPDVPTNLVEAERLLADAARAGASLAVLPENFACMPRRERDRREVAESAGDGPIQTFLAQQAARHRLWIVAGTLPLVIADDSRPAAACLVYDNDGQLAARYDKIHLFDVSLPDGAESYAESANTAPGDEPVVTDSPAGRLGLAVCYDVRFPELFRDMLEQGLQTLALPAAFTATTGMAHWETLLRARAIENQCWMIAAAQGGLHPGGRQTHGDSMIVDPWGRILARRATGPGVLAADIDLSRQARIRRRFPVLTHRRARRSQIQGVEHHD
jgi:nitrilase